MYNQLCFLLLFYSLLLLYCNWISVNKWTWTLTIMVKYFHSSLKNLFFWFMFNIHDLQCWTKVLRQLCSPAFDSDSIIKSSTYRRELNLVPLGKTKGSDKMFLKEWGKSLMYWLKRSGLKMQPWRTPLASWNDCVWKSPILTEPVELWSRFLIKHILKS